MKKTIIKIVRLTVPYFVLRMVFPSIFPVKLIYDRFITIRDTISNKSFKMFLRKDSYMEKIFLSKGLYGEWEKESLKIWAELSKNADTIIDIGANTGIYSLLARNNNNNAKIIAIEPVEINHMVLIQNIKKNKFSIFTEKVAISDINGLAKMYMLKDQLNYMTSINNNRYDQCPEVKGNKEVVEIEVVVKPFAYICEKYNIKKIDLIKIDVEGYETTVIKTMLPYLKKYRPTLLIEIIGEENAELLDKIFREMGYKYVCIDERKISVVVEKLWDNNHHNFLICDSGIIQFLRTKNLIN